VKVYHRMLQLDERSRLGPGDGQGGVSTDELLVGVWVSTRRPEVRSGSHGAEGLVEFDIPDSLFERYEWTDEDKPFREALIPAAVLQRFGRRPWVEPDDSVVSAERRREAESRGDRRGPGRSSNAVKAVIGASAVVLLRRAWKRRPRNR
jgi:hypothetical protein